MSSVAYHFVQRAGTTVQDVRDDDIATIGVEVDGQAASVNHTESLLAQSFVSLPWGDVGLDQHVPEVIDLDDRAALTAQGNKARQG